MDISKINPFISQNGFDTTNLNNISSNEDINDFAIKNGIDINEAKKIIQEAKTAIDKKENLYQKYSEIQELLQSQDEEEIIEIEDMDFDTFLNEENPEQKIQKILAQQQFLKENNSQNSNNNEKNRENPFIKTKW